MMANWSLDRLVREAAGLEAPVLLLAGDRDAAVPPSVSRDMTARLSRSTFRLLPGRGHLAHEEAPAEVAEAVIAFLAGAGAP
jgi:magnesium chelatase accessory protein